MTKRLLMAVGLALMASAAVVPISASSSHQGPRSPTQRNTAYCLPNVFDQKCLVRPRTITIGAHTVLRKLHWQKWGDGPARARGTFYDAGNVSEPPTSAPVLVHLRSVQACNGRLWYRKAGFHLHGRRVVLQGFVNPCTPGYYRPF